MDNVSSKNAMIVTVGGTPQPIIKVISKYNPQFVSFLASQQSVDLVGEIRKEIRKTTGQDIESEITIVDDINDLYHCYRKADEAVERVLKRGYQEEDVVVDYTGGTKNMSVAVSLVAINNRFVFSYVGGTERTKGGLGVVLDGKEEVYENINPWDFLCLEERKMISLLFNRYQFAAAKSVAEGLVEKSTKFKPLFRKLSFVIEGFYMWDMFKHNKAKKSFRRARLDELTVAEDPKIVGFAEDVKRTIKRLDEILGKSEDGRRLCDELIHDLLSNAERRFKEGKIDDAILRLYRVVEMIAQLRLKEKHAIDTSDVKAEQIPVPLRDEFVKYYKSERDGKIKIPLEASYRLLESLGDEYGRLFVENRNRFFDIQTARNHSYLAHGIRSSREDVYNRLKNFIFDLGMLSEKDIVTFPTIDL